jgi:thioredoxin 1
MSTIELTAANFTDHVEADDILLVDFWASWCGPCRQFAPIYEAASEKHPDIVFGSVNTEEQQELASAFRVTSIPTLMVFREQVLIYAQPGALPEQSLEQMIEAVRKLDMDDVRKQLKAEQG